MNTPTPTEYEKDLLSLSISELIAAVSAGDVLGIKLTQQQQQRLLEGAVSDAIKFQTDKRLAEYRETLRKQRDHQVLDVRINGISSDTVFVGSPFELSESVLTDDNYVHSVQSTSTTSTEVQLFSDYWMSLDDFYKNAVRDEYKHFAGMLHLTTDDPDVKPIIEYVNRLRSHNGE